METQPTLGMIWCDRYRLEEKVTRDDVYRATDLSLGEQVSIKVLQPPTRPGFRARARLAMRLGHPLILRLYSHEQHAPWEFLVLELAQGRRLRRRQHLSVGATVQVGLDCLEALAYAHAGGVTHGDLRPGNLLRTHAGALKVCDFALSEAGTVEGDLAALAATLEALSEGHLPPVVQEFLRQQFVSAAQMAAALARVRRALDGTPNLMEEFHSAELRLEFDPPERR